MSLVQLKTTKLTLKTYNYVKLLAFILPKSKCKILPFMTFIVAYFKKYIFLNNFNVHKTICTYFSYG